MKEMDDFNKLIIKLINNKSFKLRIVDFNLKLISLDIQNHIDFFSKLASFDILSQTYKIQFFEGKEEIEFSIWCELEKDFIKYKTFVNLNDLLDFFKNKNLLED